MKGKNGLTEKKMIKFEIEIKNRSEGMEIFFSVKKKCEENYKNKKEKSFLLPIVTILFLKFYTNFISWGFFPCSIAI